MTGPPRSPLPQRSPLTRSGKTRPTGPGPAHRVRAATEPAREEREDGPVRRWKPRSRRRRNGARSRGAGRRGGAERCDRSRDTAATEPAHEEREDVGWVAPLLGATTTPQRSPLTRSGKTNVPLRPEGVNPAPQRSPLTRSGKTGGRRGEAGAGRCAATEPAHEEREDDATGGGDQTARCPPQRSPLTRSGKTRLSDPLDPVTKAMPQRSPLTRSGKTRRRGVPPVGHDRAATEPAHEEREDGRRATGDGHDPPDPGPCAATEPAHEEREDVISLRRRSARSRCRNGARSRGAGRRSRR